MMSTLILVGSIVVGSIILLTSIWSFITKNYIRIAPNTAAVVFGRKSKRATGNSKGYRLITGGGVFKIPFFEEVKFIDLSTRVIPIKVDKAPNKDGVMTSVDGVANVKLSSKLELLETAVERFLGKSDQELNNIIFQNLEGHLRSVVGKMTMEELIGNKQALNQAVLEDATEDFLKMGITIDSLNIQDIKDENQYIENLGKKRIAQIKKDADIGTAEALRDSTIKTTTANKEAVEQKNKNEIAIVESDRNREIKKAEMNAEIASKTATAAQAGPLAEAMALKDVVEARAKTEAAQETAQISVETAKAERAKQRLKAEQIVPMEAERESKIIHAKAIQESAIIEAEGIKRATMIKAEGDAEAMKMKKLAEAEAEAAIIKRKGEAEGDAIRAKLLAEAEGTLKKAEAYAKLDQTGKLLQVLDSLQTLGPNMIAEFAKVMAASTAHLGNVKEIKVVDFGGGSNGQTTIGKFGSVPTEIITKFMEGMKGTGLDVSKLINFLGIKDTLQLSSGEKSTEAKEERKK